METGARIASLFLMQSESIIKMETIYTSLTATLFSSKKWLWNWRGVGDGGMGEGLICKVGAVMSV